MFRIRFHGRGGQGMKTAGRILGTAFFLEGFEVQDSPKYGAERRGAPLTAAVRASHQPIHERGIILRPDLVVVADDTLIPVQSAGVLLGIEDRTILLVNSETPEKEWQQRLQLKCPFHALPATEELDRADQPFVGASCAGAAARLIGCISEANLIAAVKEELTDHPGTVIDQNIASAVAGYQQMGDVEGAVTEGGNLSARDYSAPEWIDLQAESANLSGPSIHGSATSIQVRTGLWRTMRPVIEYDHCNQCTWICGSFCPDSAILVNDEGFPEIDYDHCKGCLICVAQCPPHAIVSIPEHIAAAEEI